MHNALNALPLLTLESHLGKAQVEAMARDAVGQTKSLELPHLPKDKENQGTTMTKGRGMMWR
jgi:hypothetical protein